MKILGVDPGLNISGYGILESNGDRLVVVEAGVIRSRTDGDLPGRLLDIANELGNVMAQFEPEMMAIEELYSHYGHPRTAIIMGHARGVALQKAAEAGIPVFPYSATRIKKSLTGNGRASKRQMQMMITTTLGLAEVPEPPDVADALAVALCHARTIEREDVVTA